MVWFITLPRLKLPQGTPNIVSSTGINTEMSVGDSMSVVIITTDTYRLLYSVTVDGGGENLKWVGGLCTHNFQRWWFGYLLLSGH